MASSERQPWERQKLLSPNLVLFGPPGVGKSQVSERLARRLHRPFVDTDRRVKERAGKPIERIFDDEGEDAFRRMERQVCFDLARRAGLVIACGGGALVDPSVRDALAATGTIVCLGASVEVLEARLGSGGGRPLIQDDAGRSVRQLLRARQIVYDSFSHQLDTTDLTLTEVVDRLEELVREQEAFERIVAQGHGYPVRMAWGALQQLPEWLMSAGLDGPLAIVSDDTVGPLHARGLAEQLGAPLIQVPTGEASKSLRVLERLGGDLLAAGVDRTGALIAVGGGVVTDLGGLAAATYMRGIPWVAVPTTLLGMVDAAIGGKVGVDLPAGKNLVGAFHPPMMVVADLGALETLPTAEWRNGMAELIKSAVIGDVQLFRWLEEGMEGPTSRWVARAQDVKIGLVEEDAEEQGSRAKLNAGHTVGHALEVCEDYRLAHGHAVSLGLVAESDMAERLGMAQAGWRERLAGTLGPYGLPTAGRWDPERVVTAMGSDKKSLNGRPRFALPVEPGRVEYGVDVPRPMVRAAIQSLEETT